MKYKNCRDRLVGILVAVVATALVCVPVGAQVLDPPAGFWVSVDGVRRDLKRSTITRERIVAKREVEQRHAANSAEEQAQVDREAHALWCENLRADFESLAKEKQIRRFGLTVSKEEMVEAWGEVRQKAQDDGTVKYFEERAKVLELAFADVYDRKLKPEDVWAQRLKPLNFPEVAWRSYLQQGQTPEGRRNLVARDLAVVQNYQLKTPPQVLEINLLFLKLPRAVDDQIALEDPRFAEYLREVRAVEKRTRWSSSVRLKGSGKIEYMDLARARWWEARYREQIILSSDPDLAKTCKIEWMAQRR